ncbi:unnamed protein product [Acanthoscelides obtectus]|uniref:Uncharacterized protein n=1 Tax=Acanthoscelides obtectus TaxID=200917 RepID=A0A9P0KSF4_ACAOB|nr:unnamed protein product [Acanthoscelides obtectus]CAK1677022.1 hypothetical protein AOBTE_LOCUS31073 [Acanthoscelides obtectus]
MRDAYGAPFVNCSWIGNHLASSEIGLCIARLIMPTSLPEVSAPSAPSAPAVSRPATGYARLVITSTTWHALLVQHVIGSCLRGRSSPYMKTEFSARHTTLRFLTGELLRRMMAAMRKATTKTRRNGCEPPSRRSSCRCYKPISSWIPIRTGRTWNG